jgi:hypothetical protein
MFHLIYVQIFLIGRLHVNDQSPEEVPKIAVSGKSIVDLPTPVNHHRVIRPGDQELNPEMFLGVLVGLSSDPLQDPSAEPQRRGHRQEKAGISCLLGIQSGPILVHCQYPHGGSNCRQARVTLV